MKAITILEPWASLIAYGEKKIETRSWETKYRGRIVIHAGKSKKYIRGVIAKFNGIQLPDKFTLNYGKVIAIADLVDCTQFVHSLIPGRNTILLNGEEVTEKEIAFGDCTVGRWALGYWRTFSVLSRFRRKDSSVYGIWMFQHSK